MATASSLNPNKERPTQRSSSSQPSQKRRKSSNASKPPSIILTLTNPHWFYIHLQHLFPSPAASQEIDAVTAALRLNAATTQFLGLHGAAIPVDILKIDGSEVWIRVPAEDRSGFVAAVGGWVGRGGEGWRVMGWSAWWAGAGARDGGRYLFEE